jgi:hypothetical protein
MVSRRMFVSARREEMPEDDGKEQGADVRSVISFPVSIY